MYIKLLICFKLAIKTIINPLYKGLENFITEVPFIFEQQGETIHNKRNILKIISTEGININIKSFKIPNSVNQFIYGNFRLSKARRSFEYATILLEKNINTPAPIAYIEEKHGIRFCNSYYLSVQEESDGLMRELKTGKLTGRETLLKQFAEFTADMHNKGVLHLDFSPGNILYKKTDPGYTFFLVDLNRMYFGEVSKEKGCENFRRLSGSDEMISYIAAKYAEARGFAPTECIDLTLYYHKKFWKEFTKKYKDRSPYIGE